MTPTLPARSATGANVAVLATADSRAASAVSVPTLAISPVLPSPTSYDNDDNAASTAPQSTATVLPTAASAMPSAAAAALAPFQHQLLALHTPPQPVYANVTASGLARDPSARAPPPLARAEANARAGALKHSSMHAALRAPASPNDSGNGGTTHETNGTSRTLAPITPLSLASAVPARSPTQHIPCKFYKAGLCSAGTNCSFSHTRDPMASPAICKYHAKGACKFGTKCALAHLGPPAMLAGFGAALGNGVGSAGSGSGNGSGSAPSSAAAAAAALEALLSPPPVPNTSFVQQMQHHQQQQQSQNQQQQQQPLQQQQNHQQQHLPSYSSSVAPPRSPVPSPLQHRSFRLSLTAASALSNSHGGHHHHQDLPSPSARSPARMRRASTLSASYAGLSGFRGSASAKPLLSTSSLHRANGAGGAPWSPLPPLPTPTSSAGPGLSLSVSTAALPPLSSSLSASLTSPNPWSPYSTSSPARPDALDMARLHGTRDMPLPPPSPHHGYPSTSSRMLPPASFGALPPPPASPLPPGTGPVSASYSAGFATGLGLSYGSFSFQDDAFPTDRRRGSDHHHHQMPHTALDRRDLLTPTEQLRFSSQRRVPASMSHAAPAAYYPGVSASPGELRKSDSAVLLEEEAIFSMEALDAALMSPTAAHASTAAATASATSSWR
ncbi:hypothetical protein AMAG_05336 [Allomyces macrogynus ATCC 38327]|uniref:C3H1-type domain-containing protein n=1 Tax=Allomyces macrogynus (strain ATCC 38327) TaxID=578462 RepID=A0A0L0SBR9_ALLM3|nr:hypothetical protein AMAG_05336 [Allomyces macrogynus ATCC 38327]|eukprot:KNE59887.1 hypothetical protein AMAG_05336 [Allomyces macrogynus ATCC 38327]